MLAGGLLGAVGTTLPLEVRVACASLLALSAVLIGCFELLGRSISLPQFDRETPQSWLHKGALTWALLNGLSLGVGATSRIGFWTWYAIPLSALLFGNPILGACIYGAYSVTRGTSVWLIIFSDTIGWLGEDWEVGLIARLGTARKVAAGQLIVIGFAGTIALGL